jgi:DNA-binding IclR family transcriptional regulator
LVILQIVVTQRKKSIALFDAILDEILSEGSTGVSSLAESLDEPVTTIHGYLRSMEKEGWLVNDSGTYRASSRCLQYGDRMRKATPAGTIAKRHLGELSEEVGWTTDFVVEERGFAVTLDRYEKNNVRGLPELGGQTQLHTTAAGRAILAHLPSARIDDAIAGVDASLQPPKPANTADEQREQLGNIREQGFAQDLGQWRQGVYCCAAPILTESSGIAGAVCIWGLSTEVDEEPFDQEFEGDQETHDRRLPEAARRTANQIQVEIDQ